MSSQATRHIKAIVGENIRRARDSRKLTQRQVGGLVNGLDATAVSRWERGVVLPSVESMTALAEIFETDIAWFYMDHGTEEVPS